MAVIPGFDVQHVLGHGGFGVVFAARRKNTGEDVAIKLVHSRDATAAERFTREIEVLQQIGWPHVPRVYERGLLDDGSPFVAMDWIRRPTLAEILARSGEPLETDSFGVYADAILTAVAIVHDHGYVHRDLKPENIFPGDVGQPTTLIDLGLARARAGSSTLTGPGVAMGSAEYMAPEQWHASQVLDVRTDVYALGVVFYEMVTATVPFWRTLAEMEHGHTALRPRRPSSIAPVSPAVEEVILRCLAKAPEDRFPDVPTLRVALRNALASETCFELNAAALASRPSIAVAASKRSVGLLFFESTAAPPALQEAAAASGGRIAYALRSRFVLSFDAADGENPARRALATGQQLIARGILSRCLVDVERTAVRATAPAGGVSRVVTPKFQRMDSYPSATDPDGVMLTPAAASAIPNLAVLPVDEHPGWLRPATTAAPPTPLDSIVPLIGREDVLGALGLSLDLTLRTRTPTLATVVAEPGFGKSRLCQELVAALRARDSGERVVSFSVPDPAGGQVHTTLRALLRLVIDVPEDAPPDRGREILGRQVQAESPNAWAAVALALGWLPDDAAEVAPLAAAPGAIRGIVVSALSDGLRRRAKRGAMILVIDDAQHADHASLDALEQATTVADVPLWICVFARPTLEAAHPSWGTRAILHRRFPLDALDSDGGAKLCRALLEPATSIPVRAIERILDRTHGVPLLMVEFIRGLKRDGMLRRAGPGDAWTLASEEIDRLPELPLVRWLAERELAALPSDLVPLAKLAALLGTEMTLSEIAGVLHEAERHAQDAAPAYDARVGLETLVAAGVLRPTRNTQFAFRHALLRDAIVDSIPITERTRLHGYAATVYRHSIDLPDELRLPRLAAHVAGSGAHQEAGSLYLELAERARRRHEYVEAETLYSRGLELLGEEAADRTRAVALHGRGLVRYRCGRHTDAIDDFAHARLITARLGDRLWEITVLLDTATALDWMENVTDSQARIEEAAALAGSGTTPFIEAQLAMARGRSAYRASRWAEASDALALAAHLSARVGDAAYETQMVSLLLLGFMLPSLGRVDEAERVLDDAYALAADRGDRVHLAAAIGNRQCVWLALKAPDRITDDCRRVIAIAQELGMLGLEYQSLYNLCEHLYFVGQLDAESPELARLDATERRALGEDARPLADLLRARLHAYLGNRDVARETMARISVRCARRGGPEVVLQPNEMTLFTMVELATRDTTDADWEALMTRSKTTSVIQEPLEVLELRALSLSRQGRDGEAEHAMRAALELAETIPNVISVRMQRWLDAPR